MVAMGLGGEGQCFRQSPHLARHDATRRSGLSATERYWGRGCVLDIAAPHRLRMPPHLKIRSPQWVVSLQHPQDQIELESLSIEASGCAATRTVTPEPCKVCVKHIEGHAVLRSRAGSLQEFNGAAERSRSHAQWRVLSGSNIRQ